MPEINFNVEVAKKLYDKLPYWKKAKGIILKYFKDNLKEKNEEVILIKVLLIDGLYGTNLKTIPGGSGALKIAEMIKKLYDKENLLDLILNEEDKNAFQIINNKSKEIYGQYIFSFATKYCHFHNQKKFPMYDQYVRAALKDLKIKSKFDWIKPEIFFCDIMNELLEKKGVKNFEELDTFLWLYGQKLKYVKYDKKGKEAKINQEVKNLFKANRELLSDLKIT